MTNSNSKPPRRRVQTPEFRGLGRKDIKIGEHNYNSLTHGVLKNA